MSELIVSLAREETEAVLIAALREVYGEGARLEGWAAFPLSKRGKHRSVHYQLRVAGVPRVHHVQWAGKFYASAADGCRVATVLRQVAAADRGAHGALVVPSLIAYDPARRLLLSKYEPGESIVAALAHGDGPVVRTLGRVVAALHGAQVGDAPITSPASMLEDLRPRIVDLAARLRGAEAPLWRVLPALERLAPPLPARPSFLHGDLGPSQILWRGGRVVILDFDKWTRGDPASDLGNLLTQLRRITLRRPGKLPAFASLRSGLLDAYRYWTAPDPGLARRVGWYERLALLRKAHFLASNTTRHEQPEALRQRRTEAMRLVRELSAAARDEGDLGERHAG